MISGEEKVTFPVGVPSRGSGPSGRSGPTGLLWKPA